MNKTDKKYKMWAEELYPDMSEDNTNYYELIVARANVHKKASRLEAKGLLMILVSGVILVLPNILPSFDFLSFARSVLLCFLAIFIPFMHYGLTNRKTIIEGYITKGEYDGLLNMISNKKSNKIINSITSLIFAGVCAYTCYLMWLTPFLFFVNYIACFITTYSCVGIWTVLASKSVDKKKMVQEVLTQQNMTMKDLYDKVEDWILAEDEN